MAMDVDVKGNARGYKLEDSSIAGHTETIAERSETHGGEVEKTRLVSDSIQKDPKVLLSVWSAGTFIR